jgi:hypothetical protein
VNCELISRSDSGLEVLQVLPIPHEAARVEGRLKPRELVGERSDQVFRSEPSLRNRPIETRTTHGLTGRGEEQDGHARSRGGHGRPRRDHF